MGQKSNPIGLRLQINRTWDSRWFAEGDDYGRLLLEDLKIRRFIMDALPQAAISKVVIERPAKLCRVSIYAARPGVIIGKKGADIEKLRKQLGAMTSSDVSLNIVEIRKPEIDSRLVAQGVADQLERRVAFRRAMKRAVQSALRLGAEGIRITCSGSAAHAARQRRLCRGHGPHRLWRVRGEGLDLQGRDPRSRPARSGPADDGGSNLRRPSGPLSLFGI
jgi:small subunit ribosomal protein S3